MGRKFVEHLVDDLDGTVMEPDEGVTVTFSLEGRAYEIDLTHAHAQQLRETLEPYVTAGRSSRRQAAARGRSASWSRASAQRKGYNLSAIRAWARENGHDVSDRGRVPNSVIDAYEAAQ
ncbi:Lsr2 family protein [Kocuria sp. 2SI]|uniref:histone-like nucleoid-structuring protein Lsr2 n=1 Tax=Kocuria sp. 2SI TaxID=2502203 RepID=UPI0010F68C82|nr:Lsr2 family protein [Kocuria sp. 2SI]